MWSSWSSDLLKRVTWIWAQCISAPCRIFDNFQQQPTICCQINTEIQIQIQGSSSGRLTNHLLSRPPQLLVDLLVQLPGQSSLWIVHTDVHHQVRGTPRRAAEGSKENYLKAPTNFHVRGSLPCTKPVLSKLWQEGRREQFLVFQKDDRYWPGSFRS